MVHLPNDLIAYITFHIKQFVVLADSDLTVFAANTYSPCLYFSSIFSKLLNWQHTDRLEGQKFPQSITLHQRILLIVVTFQTGCKCKHKCAQVVADPHTVFFFFFLSPSFTTTRIFVFCSNYIKRSTAHITLNRLYRYRGFVHIDCIEALTEYKSHNFHFL